MRRQRGNNDEDNGFAEWGGYMEAKKSKLREQYQKQFEEVQSTSKILSGVAIFVNGYTDPSAEELKRLMTVHGGVYHHYECSATTHIIATILPNVKIKQLNNRIKVVKPSWIVDSINAGKLLDYTNYLLYTNQSETQPKLTTIIKPTGDSQRVKTAVDPNFLSEFYQNSRLHLISTLGAKFKQKICDLREQRTNNGFPAREKIRNYLSELGVKNESFPSETVVMHIDMDCFFVSVGLLSRPELRGFPVAVTHAKANQTGPERPERIVELELYKKRLQEKFNTVSDFNLKIDGVDTTNSMSEIASCSYEARQAGVKNGMFLGTALKICPDLKTIPYDFDEYVRIANILYDTVVQYTLDIEAVSCDEMFVDVTDLLNETGATVGQWATYIRDEIRELTKCPCSTGFGSNKLQARLATRSAKPNGQFHLLPHNVEEYMADIEVTSLPGVGHSLNFRLKKLNLKTCKDLQQLTLSRLQTEFGGRTGQTLYDHCRGRADKQLTFEHVRKSVSAEVNYGIRFQTDEEAVTFLKQLCGEVHTRLTDIKMQGKSISLKLMVRTPEAPVESSKFMGHGLCDQITRSTSLNQSTDQLEVITREILTIWRNLNISPSELRGIGIQISRLEKYVSHKTNTIQKLFNNVVAKNCESKQLAVDRIQPPPSNHKLDTEIVNKKSETVDQKDNNKLKRRGRPKKKLLPPSGQRTIDYFGKIKKNNETRESEKKKEHTVHKIDEEFLNSLPADIREEIIREYKLSPVVTTLPKKINETSSETVIDNANIDQSFLNALPSDIRNEVIEQYKLDFTKKDTDDSHLRTIAHFQSLPWKKFKIVIKDWFDNQQSGPYPFDVNLFAEFVHQCAIARKIEFLYCFVKYFNRLISTTLNCNWHRSYFKIIDKMQIGMMETYQAKLDAGNSIACDKCDSGRFSPSF